MSRLLVTCWLLLAVLALLLALLRLTIVLTVAALLALAGLLVPAAASVGAVTNSAEKMIGELPQEVSLPEPSEQSVMRWADGTLMARFYAENRIIVPMDRINLTMRDAVVAIEDKRFFEHSGVDWRAFAGSLWHNLWYDRKRGASTLSMQLAGLLDPELALGRNGMPRRSFGQK